MRTSCQHKIKTIYMASLLGIIFGSKFPTTTKYEASIQKLKSDYERFNQLKESDKLNRYNELKQITESGDFLELMANKKSFKKSEAYQQLKEFKNLQKDKDILWFFKTEQHNSFDELTNWTLTFEEDFNAAKLDTQKWLTGYFWGKALMNDNYVQENEKQFFTDNNVHVSGGSLKINSKQENCTGKVWNKALGFRPQEFNITSGIINTGQSFRQQYGRFEAKIKFNKHKDAQHVFCLLSETIAPQINIFKSGANAKKLSVGHFWNNNKEIASNEVISNTPSSTNQYLVYTIDWSENAIEWKINGVSIHKQTNNIPSNPMYLSLSTHFLEEPKNGLPVHMEVDWIRCYQKN